MRSTGIMKPVPTPPYLKIVVGGLLLVLGVLVILNLDAEAPPDEEASAAVVVQEEGVVEMAVKDEIQEEVVMKEKIADRKEAIREAKEGTGEGVAEAGGEEKKTPEKKETEAGEKTLADIAAAVAVNNITVYTVVGDGYVNIFENWVISFIHAIGDPPRHNFLAFAKSLEIYEELEKKFPGHAFYLSNEAEESFLEKLDDKDYDRESRNVQLAYIRRPLYAMMLLQLGYDAVYADVDSVFMKNPLRQLMSGEYDVYIAYNDYGTFPNKKDPHARGITPYEKDGHSVSGSFLYFRNTAGSRYVLSAWLKKARSVVLSDEKKEVTDQLLLQRTFWSNINYNLGKVKIGALPMYAFPPSHVYFGLKVGKNKEDQRPWRDVFKKDITFVETGWLTDIEGKVQSLKDLRLWHIGDSPTTSR